jgi:calcineurin-like phosphoesterase family protein
MSTIFYTSDQHIGHWRVSEIRGHEHPDDHDRWLAEQWDSVVRPADHIYVLGDVSVSGKQHVLDWFAARPGIKHLIAGNHDPVHPMHRGSTKLLPAWLNVFETIQPFTRRRLNGHQLLLSHFPYASFGDGENREGSRYNQYRLPDLGLPLLHGHTHGPEQAHGRMLHVGVDAWNGKPVNQTVVVDWLNSLETI